MIPVDLAQELFGAGLLWTPAPGDRFVVPDRDLDGEVFHIAEMTIEVHEYSAGRVLGFNGTTEWALDSLDLTDVLWLPREDQLRELLGARFVALERADAGWRVRTDDGAFVAADVEEAYGRALLALVAGDGPPGSDMIGA